MLILACENSEVSVCMCDQALYRNKPYLQTINADVIHTWMGQFLNGGELVHLSYNS